LVPLVEKEVALRVALLTGDALQRQGIRVVYTRTDDRFVPLAARAALAGRSGASLLLSVHVNAASDAGVRGAEAWHRPGGAGAALASATLAGLAPVLQGHDLIVRGTRDGSHLAVLRAAVPAVLVELGYLTNRQEARLLARPAYLEELARGLVAGVAHYREGSV
jgi:N-acetylmuramoyl-L-alanine amidase